MKTRTLLITTILSTSLLFGGLMMAHATDSITSDTLTTAGSPIAGPAVTDSRVAATGFVEHVNFARVALAMKNVPLAQQHVLQAKNMIALIKNASVEQRLVTSVVSGRIVYKYDTQYKYHYFPIETGPVEVKQVTSGPVWAVSNLAVTDADIVYLTLDLTGDGADTYLANADKAIVAGNLGEADDQLAKLTDTVVKVDPQVSVPSVKARDNIALAHSFLAGKNYDGASYALRHADDALDEMEKNNGYKAYKGSIVAMRKDVKALQGYITKKDPTMIEKADAKMNKWWNDMKDWSMSK